MAASYGCVGNSLIENVLKPLEGDVEILLLNFLMYLQIARKYIWSLLPKLKSTLEFYVFSHFSSLKWVILIFALSLGSNITRWCIANFQRPGPKIEPSK